MNKVFVSLIVVIFATMGCGAVSDVDKGGTIGPVDGPSHSLNDTGRDFTWSLDTNQVNSGRILVKFQPNNTCQYAILHYTVNNGVQQNVQMAKQGDGSYSFQISDYPSGGVVVFNFTYEKAGCQYDTSMQSYPDIFGISCKMRQELSKYAPDYVRISFSSSKTTFDSVVMHYQMDDGAYVSTDLYKIDASNFTQSISLNTPRSKIGYSFTYKINGQSYDSQTQFYYADGLYEMSYEIDVVSEGAPPHLWVGFTTTNLNLDSVQFCYIKDNEPKNSCEMMKWGDNYYICNIPGSGTTLKYSFEYTSGGTTYQSMENYFQYDWGRRIYQ